MRCGQDCFNLIVNTRPHSFFFLEIVCVSLLLRCVCASSHAHTPAYTHTMCFWQTTKSTSEISLSLSLSLSVCASLARPDMQEFEHELYIATQQPSSELCSQTNNGQHDNSIMKWATWPPPSRGAVTLDICISMMPGLMVAPLRAADIKKWINYFSQSMRSSEQRRSFCGNLEFASRHRCNKDCFMPQLFPSVCLTSLIQSVLIYYLDNENWHLLCLLMANIGFIYSCSQYIFISCLFFSFWCF